MAKRLVASGSFASARERFASAAKKIRIKKIRIKKIRIRVALQRYRSERKQVAPSGAARAPRSVLQIFVSLIASERGIPSFSTMLCDI